LGLGRQGNLEKRDLRYCKYCHPHESKVYPIVTQCSTIGGSTEAMREQVAYDNLPKPYGLKHNEMPPVTMSKGTGTDRMTARYLAECSSDALMFIQTLEVHDIEMGLQSLRDINPRLRAIAGLDVHEYSLNHMDHGDEQARRTKYSRSKCKCKNANKDNTNKAVPYAERAPVIEIDMKPTDVHSRTGFQDMRELLLFAAVITGGDRLLLTTTHSFLTWLEEWFFYFEFIYG